MKCDRRWYNDGRYERECAEHKRRQDEERGVKRWYSAAGVCVMEESNDCTVYAPGGIDNFAISITGSGRRAGMSERAAVAAVRGALGFDANGSPVE